MHNVELLADVQRNRMTSLNYRSKADLVADRLQEEILSGELRAGDQLKQRDIARRMGVSSTPVREAIARLAAKGLVLLEAHCPPTVAMAESERIRENFLVRASLESLAVRLATPRLSNETLDELEAINNRMSELPNDDEGVSDLNRQFHTTLVEAAELPLLSHLISQLWAALPSGPRARGRTVAESVDQHRRLINALRERDVDKATDAMEHHIMDSPESSPDGSRPPQSSV